VSGTVVVVVMGATVVAGAAAVVVVGATVVVTGGRLVTAAVVVGAAESMVSFPLQATPMNAVIASAPRTLACLTGAECTPAAEKHGEAGKLMLMTSRSEYVARALEQAADPEKAAGMATYMYGRRYQAMYPDPLLQSPYYGVPKPGRQPIIRGIIREFPVTSESEYRAAVIELWERPHREERYLAVGLAIAYPEFHRHENLDLFRRLIIEGAWWDLVDDVAIRCVGAALLAERDEMAAELDRWIRDEDLWLRRSAVIAHLKHQDATDRNQLLTHCLLVAGEREFFIRKAIGWALREYAKTDPDAVTTFLLDHRDELSGLSFREASKHLDMG